MYILIQSFPFSNSADFAPDKSACATHTTDECTVTSAANEERHQLSTGRRDPEQTHSVTHSHTDTQSEQSQVEKKPKTKQSLEEEEEEENVLRASLCRAFLVIFLSQQTCQLVSRSHLTQSVAAGEQQ